MRIRPEPMDDFDLFLRRVKDGVERGALTQQEAAHYVGEDVARRLQCASATLWTIGGPPGLRVLTRAGGFDAMMKMPLAEPLQLTLAGASAWHDALSRDGVFTTADAQGDSRLGIACAAMVGSRRVRGLLQAAIGAGAAPRGVVSCTRVDAARPWTPDETAQLRCIAAALSTPREPAPPADAAPAAAPVSRAST